MPAVTTPTIKGFEHVKRYYDPRMKTVAAKILPGECYVSNSGEMIVTVLGSCIAACIRDRELGIGGMNHFMLPVQSNTNRVERSGNISPELCYGNWAMEYLINEILKQGGLKRRLEVKLFGGARVLGNMQNMDIGKRNIEFVNHFIEYEGLNVVADDLGSDCPRKVLYFPDTGSVKLKRLRTVANDTIKRREKEYLDSMQAKPKVDNNIELF